jgi:hypothetical protein
MSFVPASVKLPLADLATSLLVPRLVRSMARPPPISGNKILSISHHLLRFAHQ